MINSDQAVKHKLGEDHVVHHADGTQTYLNSALILSRGLTADDVRLLKQLHVQKSTCFQKMHKTKSVNELKELAHEVECIEFALQKTWGFAQDKNYHEWYLVPKCSCPKMDNAERRGTPYGVISGDCLIHGFVQGKSS